jgi:phage-related tail fiber protein
MLTKHKAAAFGCATGLCLAGFTLAAQAADLPAAQAPTFAVGDSWTYSLSDPRTPSRTFMFVQTVHSIGGGTVDLTVSNNGGTMPASMDLNGNLTSIGTKQYLPSDSKLKFPIAVGGSWSSNFTTRTGNGDATTTLSAKVVGVESVQTAAGTFQAFRIEETGSVAAPDGKFQFTETDWYAPDAKRIVKFTFKGTGGDGGTFGTQALLEQMDLKK